MLLSLDGQPPYGVGRRPSLVLRITKFANYVYLNIIQHRTRIIVCVL